MAGGFAGMTKIFCRVKANAACSDDGDSLTNFYFACYDIDVTNYRWMIDAIYFWNTRFYSGRYNNLIKFGVIKISSGNSLI